MKEKDKELERRRQEIGIKEEELKIKEQMITKLIVVGTTQSQVKEDGPIIENSIKSNNLESTFGSVRNTQGKGGFEAFLTRFDLYKEELE